MRLTRFVLAVALFTGVAAPLEAQRDGTPWVAGQRYLSVIGGGSWSNSFGPRISSIAAQPYAITALRSEYVVEARGPFALAFFMELLPAIVVERVPLYHTGEFWIAPWGPMQRVVVWDRPAPVYGAGLTPVGLQLYGALSRSVSLFASASGGIAWFTRDMPVPESRRRNFTADLGGGVRIARRNRALLLGAKFHHMSNANTARQNPGVDGNVVYLGMSRAR